MQVVACLKDGVACIRAGEFGLLLLSGLRQTIESGAGGSG